MELSRLNRVKRPVPRAYCRAGLSVYRMINNRSEKLAVRLKTVRSTMPANPDTSRYGIAIKNVLFFYDAAKMGPRPGIRKNADPNSKPQMPPQKAPLVPQERIRSPVV